MHTKLLYLNQLQDLANSTQLYLPCFLGTSHLPFLLQVQQPPLLARLF
jgi:hypothetical protein